MTLRPTPHDTRPDVPSVANPEHAYRLAVSTAIAHLERAYHDAVAILHGPPPLTVSAEMLPRWNAFLTALTKCSDALCKLE